MKKILALVLALCLIFALAACGQQAAPAEKPAETPAEQPAETPAEQPAEQPTEEPAPEKPAAMSYAEFAAAAIDDPVCVECYVQAHESWWDNKVSVHAADEDGAYYIYEMACTEEDAAKLELGQKIRVSGFKGEWAGEVEIVDATFEFVDDMRFIEPADFNSVFGTEELAEHINQYFYVTGTVADKGDGAAFFYNWDNSGEDGKCDLYFDVEINGEIFTFVARRYLTEPGSEVYEAVKNLQVGDEVEITAFLYWYEGPQPHIAFIQPAASGAMTYEDYVAAAVDDPVVLELFVQAHESWWDNKVSVHAADAFGNGYYIYEMACSEEDAAKLEPGTKISVSGFKGEWAGEVEIVDAVFSFVEDGETLILEPKDFNEVFGTEELAEHINQFFKVSGTVADKGDGAAFFFNWDNSGEDGKCDLYFDVEINGETFTFVVRRYLTEPGSEAYEAVKNLKVGDSVEIEGFLYWYEGPQPHITSIAVK